MIEVILKLPILDAAGIAWRELTVKKNDGTNLLFERSTIEPTQEKFSVAGESGLLVGVSITDVHLTGARSPASEWFIFSIPPEVRPPQPGQPRICDILART